MTPGPEAICLHHGRGLGESPRERARVVRVAAERDRLATFFAPPQNDLLVERYHGVDLQCPTAAGQRSQYLPELILERTRVVRSGRCRPVADRVVDVGK